LNFKLRTGPPFLSIIMFILERKYFIELNGNPLELLSEQSVNELNVFIKLFVILYMMIQLSLLILKKVCKMHRIFSNLTLKY